jgi:hypothetical protein
VAKGTRFTGWTDHGAADRHLTTADGIGVGITVADLTSSGTEVTVTRTSGGARWTSVPAGLAGRASSTKASGHVTVVSSGETCTLG